jgi:NAD(P)-dependent dehydrogenase (short-subunit alcohol dehydrogenase family)
MKIPFKINLKDKVAVIIGGGGVLCGCFSEALAECGAQVVILDINKAAAEKVAERIKANGGIALAIETDILDIESLKRAEKIISEKFGMWSILINGAGGNHPKGTTSNEFLTKEDLLRKKGEIFTLFDLEREDIEFIFDLNFIGMFLSTQIFGKKMVNEKNAVIINISSMNAYRPLTKIPAYSGAKAAVSNFTKWLAVYMSKVNIRVNAIAPGFFLTEQNRRLLINDDGSFNTRAEKIVNHTPMGRFGKTEELIGTLLWLIDEDASSFVNGVVIPVDGGFSAYSGV